MITIEGFFENGGPLGWSCPATAHATSRSGSPAPSLVA